MVSISSGGRLLMRPSTQNLLIDFLPKARFQTYVQHCQGDRRLALETYCWNIDVAAAVLSTLGIVEVAFRSVIDNQLRAWNIRNGGSYAWIRRPVGPPLTHIVQSTPDKDWIKRFENNKKVSWDKNDPEHQPSWWWEQIAYKNLGISNKEAKKNPPTHDDLVASMTFGAWKHMIPKPTTLNGRKNPPQLTLWNDAIKRGSNTKQPESGIATSSATMHHWCAQLVRARNRASHLEPLLNISELQHWHRIACRMLTALWPGTDGLIAGPARIPNIIYAKPSLL